jgi:hypothetical protein
MMTNVTLIEPSPAAPGVVLGIKIADGLEDFGTIAAYLTLRGATGGILTVTIQGTFDGVKWFDWFRTLDIAALAAASTIKVVATTEGTSTTVVGTGTASAATPLLEKGTVVPGHPGRKLRAVFEAGAGTTLGASQEITIVGSR